MRAVLVTGAAGFIGSHVCEALTAAGFQVRGLDAFTSTYDPAVKRRNVAAVTRSPGFELVEADLLTADLVELLDDVEIVLHLAGEPGVATSWGTGFPAYVQRNVLGTQRLLEAAAGSRVDKFVYASSSSVYRPSSQPMQEASPVGPVSPYGVSKLAGECLVGAYAAERGLATVALRFFSVYGPRQRPDMAAHRFIEALLDGRGVDVFGATGQMRDFTYVADVVDGILASAITPLPPGTVLNLACGRPVPVIDVLSLLAEELDVPVPTRRLPHRQGDTPCTHGDPTAALEALGWQARTDVASGLRQQLAWHVALRVPEGRAPMPEAARTPVAAVSEPVL